MDIYIQNIPANVNAHKLGGREIVWPIHWLFLIWKLFLLTFLDLKNLPAYEICPSSKKTDSSSEYQKIEQVCCFLFFHQYNMHLLSKSPREIRAFRKWIAFCSPTQTAQQILWQNEYIGVNSRQTMYKNKENRSQTYMQISRFIFLEEVFRGNITSDNVNWSWRISNFQSSDNWGFKAIQTNVKISHATT